MVFASTSLIGEFNHGTHLKTTMSKCKRSYSLFTFNCQFGMQVKTKVELLILLTKFELKGLFCVKTLEHWNFHCQNNLS